MSEEARRFVVVGAGGTGGWLCAGLARMLEYRLPGSVLLIVDGDNFEPKNAERQDFSDVGNKAVVRAKELQPHFPNTFIIPDERWVVESIEGSSPGGEDDETKQITARDLLEEEDVVYAVVDNFAARKVLFDAAREFETINVFTGGNDDELFGSLYHYARRGGIEITDHPEEWHPEYNDPPDRNPGELSCSERAAIDGGTQLLATNMSVAGFLLGRTQKVILEGEEDGESEIMFDLGIGLAQAYDRQVEAEMATASV